MFGYVRPHKDELKLREFKEYQSYYCSLCHVLSKEYGFFSRMILNYDMTFMVISLNSAAGDLQTFQHRCPMNPAKKITANIDRDVLSYVAFANYYLFFKKISDNAIDGKNIFTRGLFRFIASIIQLNRRFRNSLSEYVDIVNVLNSHFDKVMLMEKSGNYSVDDMLNEFGSFIKQIYLGYYESRKINASENHTALVSAELFFFLGKWIYLIDAVDDYSKDIKKGRFNLLNSIKTKTGDSNSAGNQNDYSRAVAILRVLERKMSDCLHGSTLQKNEIIKNIVDLGLEATLRQKLKRRFPDGIIN